MRPRRQLTIFCILLSILFMGNTCGSSGGGGGGNSSRHGTCAAGPGDEYVVIGYSA